MIQKGMTHKGLPIHAFETVAAWAEWLAENGAASTGLWLKFYKKGSGHPTVSKAEAIEAALIHGWIDGQLDRFDDTAWLTRFTPRKSSKWSEINCKTAERLIEAEDMPDIGANSLSIAFGNFKAGYVIAERNATTILRDPYTNKPFVHFYATKRVGGQVVNSEAIKLLKFA